MALLQTETGSFLRDTSNMALVSNNKKAYDIYKQQIKIKQQKDQEIQTLKNELEELKKLIKEKLS